MKKFWKKSLIYLIMTMLVLPATLITGALSAQKAQAADYFVDQNTSSSWSLSASYQGVSDNAKVMPDDFSFGSGLIGPGLYVGGGAYASDWANDSIPVLDDYFEASLTLSSGYSANWSSLVYSEKRSGNGITGYEVRYSTDNFVTYQTLNTESGIADTMTRDETVSLTGVNLVGGQIAKIRFYGFGAVSSLGTWSILKDSLSLSGTVLPLSKVVNSTQNYKSYETIQAAIDEAVINDQILIAAGQYDEDLIVPTDLGLVADSGIATVNSIVLASSGINTTNLEAKNVFVSALASIQTGIDLVVAKTTPTDENGNVVVFPSTTGYSGSILINKDITLVSAENVLGLATDIVNNPVLKASVSPIVTVATNVTASIVGFTFDNFDPAVAGKAILVGAGAILEVHNSSFMNLGKSIDNTANGTVNASSNFWVNASGPMLNLSNIIVGTVQYSPWYTDQTARTLKYTTVLSPDGKNMIAVAGDNDSQSNLTSIGEIIVEIPSGITITGSLTWDGTFNVAVDSSTAGISINEAGKIASGSEAIEIGAGDNTLTFSQPVKITFVGKAGRSVGFVKDGIFVPITTVCQSDAAGTPINVPVDGECKANVGEDLVVWTYHFTQFVTYNSAVIIPTIEKVLQFERDGHKYISVTWTKTGASSYQFYVDGIMTTPVSITDNIALLRVNSTGKHVVKMKAIVDGVSSDFSGSKEVIIPEPIPVAQTSIVPTAAPTSAKAAVAPAPAPEQKVETPTDDAGIIKGDETKDDTSDTNWTPWIILFILIILAGAATGGYFYWFAGKEDVKEPAPSKVAEKGKGGVVVRDKSKPSNKQSKRW